MQGDGRWLEREQISILYVGDVFSTGIVLQVQRVGWSQSSGASCVRCGVRGGGRGGYALGLKIVL